MRRLAVILVLLGFMPVIAHADPLRTGVDHANALLKSGDVDGALTEYRSLQIDHPESPELYYNMGCAQYEQALASVQTNSEASGENPFEVAKASFDRAAVSGEGDVRRQAGFNRANCSAQTAKLIAKGNDPNATIEAYKGAIQEYEDFLRKHPGHLGGQKNLEHMRYELKKMLQNPPEQEPQEQQGDGENEPQEDKQQQDRGGENSEQPKDQQQDERSSSKQEQSEEQDQQNQADQQQASQQPDQPQDNQQEEEQPKSDAEQEQMAGNQEEQQDEETGKNQPEPTLPDRQTVEALLQSLDDRDRMEQREMRRAPRDPRLRGDWW